MTVTVDGKPVEVLPTSVYEGGYQITIEGIKPQELNNSFHVIATTERANETADITLRALDYAGAVVRYNFTGSYYAYDTMLALYKYYEAACNYVNSL